MKKKQPRWVFSKRPSFLPTLILNISYIFKFKSAFGNQKCTLKNIKSTLLLFSAPCLFLRLGEFENTYHHIRLAKVLGKKLPHIMTNKKSILKDNNFVNTLSEGKTDQRARGKRIRASIYMNLVSS